MNKLKTIIIIRISKQQLEFARVLENIFIELGHEAKILNLDASDDNLYIQECIRIEKANLLVTIDCTGFDLRLLGDDLFYNSLCIPAMHFITEKPWEKSEELSQRMNFDMGVYCFSKNDVDYIINNFPNIREVNNIENVATSANIVETININELYKYIEKEVYKIFN